MWMPRPARKSSASWKPSMTTTTCKTSIPTSTSPKPWWPRWVKSEIKSRARSKRWSSNHHSNFLTLRLLRPCDSAHPLMRSFGLLQHVRVHTPLFGVRPSWPYKSIFCQQVVAEIYNFPIFKRCCNLNTAPASVVFHQSFDSQASAYRKHDDDLLHFGWGPVMGVRRIKTSGRKDGVFMPPIVPLYICQRHLDLGLPNGTGERCKIVFSR